MFSIYFDTIDLSNQGTVGEREGDEFTYMPTGSIKAKLIIGLDGPTCSEIKGKSSCIDKISHDFVFTRLSNWTNQTVTHHQKEGTKFSFPVKTL